MKTIKYGRASLWQRFLRAIRVREGYIPMNMSPGWFKGKDSWMLRG